MKIENREFPEDREIWHWALMGKDRSLSSAKNIHRVSRDELLSVAPWYIRRVNTIVDIGCGIRPQAYITPAKHYCVDPHAQYLDYLKEHRTADQSAECIYINANWEQALEHPQLENVDTVFLLDVIEHLPKEEGKRLLAKTIQIAREQIVIFTPLGFVEQHHESETDAWGLDGAKWQEHLSGWIPEDFEGDWRFIVCEDFHTHDNMNNKYDEPKGAFFAILNTQSKKENASPFFSVIVPTYNQAQFLPKALDSLLEQTYGNWEAIVVNDGSTDTTAEVMDAYAFQDVRVRCFHKENGGVASALNEGLKHARGEWICWLSSDDLFEPDKLQVHLDAIHAHPEYKFFHSHFYYLVEESSTKTEPDLWFHIPDEEYRISRFFLGNYVHGNAVAIHRDVFAEVGTFDESLRQAQDFDMWLRISAKFQSYFIERRTCVTRIHAGQTTNSFPEGCYYDSAWACAKFLNKHSFAEVFPLLNLHNESDARKALLEAITLSTKNDAFMNRCGFMPALLERAHEWLTTDCPRALRPKLIDFISYILSKNNFSQVSLPVTEVMRKLGRSKHFSFRSVDFLAHLEGTIGELIKNGDQQKALLLERYALQLLHRVPADEFPVLRHGAFTPRLLSSRSTDEYLPLASGNVLSWFIEPLTYLGHFRHTLRIKCSKCGNAFPFVTELFAGEQPQEVQMVCPGCKQQYSFFDGKIDKYIRGNDQRGSGEEKVTNRTKPKVAFLARGIHGKSGGTIVFAKHIQWLADLGCDVVVYSDTPKPQWVSLPGRFVQVKDFREVQPGDVDLVVLYCMFELPDMLKKVEVSKIAYVSQAYEGYLYGRNFSELRADKPFFTALHSVPINFITVSRHLSDHFQKKFNRTSYYVPNSVNHAVFKPDPVAQKDSPSILFMGNPYHLLKGFDFLRRTINSIQQSKQRVDNLKLIVATGISSFSDEQTREQLQSVVNCEVVFRRGLSNKEVAVLINSVDMVICTSWYEGFSLVVLEAMACGTPVITTNNMGSESFCRHGFNAFVVEYGNINSLGSAILTVLDNPPSVATMRINALKTSLEYSDVHSFNHFVEAYSKLLKTTFDNKLVRKMRENLVVSAPMYSKNGLQQAEPSAAREKFSVTYFISSILGVTGGNQTLLKQANALVERGHRVTIVTHSESPSWFKIKARVQRVSSQESLAKHAPPTDIAISTYFTNTAELNEVSAAVKIYFAQGDQFIFEDESVRLRPELESVRSHLKELSRASYQDPNILLVANSKTLAERILKQYGRTADAILNVGLDENIFRPLQRSTDDSRPRILIVGPDVLGTELEPLTFKGMGDIRKALERLSKKTKNFTVVRISNSEPSIFKDFPSEFYIAPNDEVKTFLYGTAQILVYASHYESWGLPPLEAMASGAAVVCTATSAAMEYCRNGENCLLVPPKSPDALYHAIDTLLTNQQLRKHIVEGGFETAKLYTKKGEWDELERLLYTFVAEKNKNQQHSLGVSIAESHSRSSTKLIALVNNALSMVHAAHYERAITSIEEAEQLLQTSSSTLSDDSDGAVKEEDLYNLKGHSYLGLNDLEHAKAAFEQALQHNPESSEACAGLGEVFYRAEMDKESKTMFEWAVKNDPNNSTAIQGLAKVNAVFGLPDAHSNLLVAEQAEVSA